MFHRAETHSRLFLFPGNGNNLLLLSASILYEVHISLQRLPFSVSMRRHLVQDAFGLQLTHGYKVLYRLEMGIVWFRQVVLLDLFSKEGVAAYWLRPIGIWC